MNRALALSLALGAVLLACDDDGNKDEAAKPIPPPTAGGELGKAIFTYKCLLQSDASCDNDALGVGAGGGELHFPTIATGSQFGMMLQPYAQPAFPNPAPVLTALHPDYATVDAATNNVTALKAGNSSIGLILGPDVYDILDIAVADPHLRIDNADPQGEFKDIKVSGGKVTATGTFTFRFRATPADNSNNVLAGSFPCLWTTSDKDIANITTDPTDNIVTVVSGSKTGTAVLHVTLGPTMVSDIPITLGGN